MKKLILNWLFGTENVKRYMELLERAIDHEKICIDLIDDHIKSLEKSKTYLDNILKLIKICENNGIDVDKELKKINFENNN